MVDVDEVLPIQKVEKGTMGFIKDFPHLHMPG